MVPPKNYSVPPQNAKRTRHADKAIPFGTGTGPEVVQTGAEHH